MKFAAFEVLSSVLVPKNATRAELRILAHKHNFDYEVRPGFLYVRSRAISSRCNDNYDEFPGSEIKEGFRSFIGKPVFVNHNNDNHRRARGVVIDAALHEDKNPDGSEDIWVEALMEVDAIRFPKLAEAIDKGHIARTSMGTDVAHSICSVCNNKATTPAEYCAHIPRMKGQRIYRHTANGKKEGILVREICYGLKFFENSLLVEPPADPTAYFLGVDKSGLGKAASKAKKSETQPKPDDLKEAMEGMSLSKDDDGYFVHTHRARSDSYETPHKIPKKDLTFIESTGILQHFAEANEEPTGDDLRNHLHQDHAIDPHLIHRYPAEYLHDMHHRDVKTEMPDADSGRTNVLHTHSAKLGFGEIKAPADVDTLRDEGCPVCSETDSYDGNECQTCGFIAPPKMFQDPDLDVAKSMDMRQDQTEMQDMNAGMPDEVPGSEFAGENDTTVDENGEVVDPSMVGDDGSIAGPQVGDDPAVVDGEVRTLGDQPVDPSLVDEQGNVLDPETDAVDGRINQGGEPFTPGPNVPGGPEDPEGPEGPQPPVDDAVGAPEDGYPGTPGDAVPDLSCPSCGFQAPGSSPMSTNMNDPMAPVGQADGLLAGDICPNCQRATLLSVGETNRQQQAVEQMQGMV